MVDQREDARLLRRVLRLHERCGIMHTSDLTLRVKGVAF